MSKYFGKVVDDSQPLSWSVTVFFSKKTRVFADFRTKTALVAPPGGRDISFLSGCDKQVFLNTAEVESCESVHGEPSYGQKKNSVYFGL